MVQFEDLRILVEALGLALADLQAWALAWARLTPLVVLVPAFGLRAVPAPTRVAIAASLALVIAPALEPVPSRLPWALALAAEFVRGLPLALVAASTLWVASMAGGLMDNLRSANEAVALPNVEAQSTPIGALLTMLVAIAFLKGGGAAHAAALAVDAGPVTGKAALEVASTLSHGIGLGVMIAAPLLAVSIVTEVASALVARAASPAFVQPTLGPLRTLCILGVSALLLDRFVELLVMWSRHP